MIKQSKPANPNPTYTPVGLQDPVSCGCPGGGVDVTCSFVRHPEGISCFAMDVKISFLMQFLGAFMAVAHIAVELV